MNYMNKVISFCIESVRMKIWKKYVNRSINIVKKKRIFYVARFSHTELEIE